ncbi:unnamed protein product [Lasius platythorax]|uniref:Uncharacterized protein n=1 Tax=Lasius platythorax TaxID=488582 RepID=A0AAV2N3K8_9HYME
MKLSTCMLILMSGLLCHKSGALLKCCITSKHSLYSVCCNTHILASYFGTLCIYVYITMNMIGFLNTISGQLWELPIFLDRHGLHH